MGSGSVGKVFKNMPRTRIKARIGPAFAEELRAAGLGDGINWSADRVTVMDGFSAAAVQAVVDDHDPRKTPARLPEVVERAEVVEKINQELARSKLDETEARTALSQARALLAR